MLTVVPLILNMSLAKFFLSAAVKTKFRLKSLLSSKFPIFKSFHFHFRFESVLYANEEVIFVVVEKMRLFYLPGQIYFILRNF
jgi:hypothetical protein